MPLYLTNIAYLFSAILFIVGLKGLTAPKTARQGNLTAALGMLIAILVTLLHENILDFTWIGVGLLVGAIIGGLLSQWIQMTAMPQLVALFNGFGGLASAIVASSSLITIEQSLLPPDKATLIAVTLSVLIGAVTFTGSMLAFSKLQGLVKGGGIGSPWQQIINVLLFALAIFAAVWVIDSPHSELAFGLLGVVAFILGWMLVLPIGGADMPVVVELLNSYSGLAACATGFVLKNNMLIIAGSLVGASGFILTQIMCKAMNRSLANVMFATLPPAVAGTELTDIYEGKIQRTSPEEVAMLLQDARTVMIVPGYGMAVSQAQHAVEELFDLLESEKIKVMFGIHPVAGRMPGHMNVLLAEANIPYERLLTLEESNAELPQTDVVIILGANDVVNPLARDDDSGPIAGMPILNVDQARTVVMVKRSLSPGFAGVPNPLFTFDNTLMMFGDGKKMMQALVMEMKELL